MSDNLKKFAQLFTERNNLYRINITTGIVKSVDPLMIAYGDSIILTKDNLIVANLLANGFTVEYTDEYTDASGSSDTLTKQITIKNPLQVDDKVIIVPDDDFKMWYVIDKEGEL